MWRAFLDSVDMRVDNQMLAVLSIFLLLLVVFTSVYTVMNFNYRISAVRVVGHVLLGIWALSRVEHKLGDLVTTTEYFILYLALALLCLDTLFKYHRHKRKKKLESLPRDSELA